MFRVAIIGGENLGDYRLFAEKCIHFLKNRAKEGITILSVGDKFVDIFAKATNIDVKQYNAEWGKYGKNALKNRINEMLRECDAVIIFEDGTKETKYFWNKAIENNVPLRVVRE